MGNKLIFARVTLDNGSSLSPYFNAPVNNSMTLSEFKDALHPFAKTAGSAKYGPEICSFLQF